MFALSTRRIPSGSTANGAGTTAARRTTWAPTRAYYPPIELAESSDQYRLMADIPGVDPETVTVTVENNMLHLRGEKRMPYDSSESVYRSERWFGPFERKFTLSADVDTERIEARCEAGVLTVTIPKAAEARARQIPIHSS